MAFFIKSEKDKEKQQIRPQSDPNAVAVSGNAPVGGGGAPGTPVAPVTGAAPGVKPESQRQSGRFTDLGKYLQANQGSGLADKVAGNVEQTGADARKSLQEASGAFTQAAGQGSVGFDKDVIEKGISAAGKTDASSQSDWQKYQDYQSKLASGYKGPKSIVDVTDPYAKAQAAYQKAEDQVKLSDTEQGRQTLLKTQFAKPGYSNGQSKLDQMILQNDPQSQARFSALKSLAGDLPKELSNAEAQSKTLAANEQSNIQSQKDYLANRLKTGTTTTPLAPTIRDYLKPAETAPAKYQFDSTLVNKTGSSQEAVQAAINELKSIAGSNDSAAQSQMTNLGMLRAQQIAQKFGLNLTDVEHQLQNVSYFPSGQLPAQAASASFADWTAAQTGAPVTPATPTPVAKPVDPVTGLPVIQAPTAPQTPPAATPPSADMQTQLNDLNKRLAYIGTPEWQKEQEASAAKYGPSASPVTAEAQKAAVQQQIADLQKQMGIPNTTVGAGLSNFEKTINQRIVDTQKQQQDRVTQLKNRLQEILNGDGVLDRSKDPELAQLMGFEGAAVNLKNNNYGINWMQYLGAYDPTPIDKFSVMTPDEKSQYLALAQSAGIDPTNYFVGQTQNVGNFKVGGSYDKNALNTAVTQAQRAYTDQATNTFKNGVQSRAADRGDSFLTANPKAPAYDMIKNPQYVNDRQSAIDTIYALDAINKQYGGGDSVGHDYAQAADFYSKRFGDIYNQDSATLASLKGSSTSNPKFADLAKRYNLNNMLGAVDGMGRITGDLQLGAPKPGAIFTYDMLAQADANLKNYVQTRLNTSFAPKPLFK